MEKRKDEPGEPDDFLPENSDSGPPFGIGKAQIREKLIEKFSSNDMLRALSRFSIALLGCPVEGRAANTVFQIRIGEVKALFFDASERVEMQIKASRTCGFTLDIFRPELVRPRCFGPVAIDPEDE